jgi:DTW domain-containing protein YfiP
MHVGLCFCATIPRLVTRTRVVLVMHRFEDRKPTNTGRLATECLENSETVIRGDDSGAPADVTFAEGARPVLLFPARDARPLEEFRDAETPLTLVVPDGNWRQASKVKKRVRGLAEIPCATLSGGPPSAYRLRTEHRETDLSTIEAIARALGLLEGAEVRLALETVFHTMVERTLWARGALATDRVASGIPAGAKPHDPVSGCRTTDSLLP